MRHLQSALIRQPNIKQQMHMLCRRINIRHQIINHTGRIAGQIRSIPRHRRKTIDRLTNAKHLMKTLRNRVQNRSRNQIRHVRSLKPLNQTLAHLMHALRAFRPDIRLTQQHINHHTENRHSQNQQHPRDARGRLAIWAQHHPPDKIQHQHIMNDHHDDRPSADPLSRMDNHSSSKYTKQLNHIRWQRTTKRNEQHATSNTQQQRNSINHELIS